MKRSVQRILAGTLTLGALTLLAGCPSSDHSSSGDSQPLPLAYTGKTEAADLSNITPDEQQQLSETVSILLGSRTQTASPLNTAGSGLINSPVAGLVGYHFNLHVSHLMGVVEETLLNSVVTDTSVPLPTTPKALTNPSPCTTTGSIHYKSYDNSDRYAQVTYDNACIVFSPHFSESQRDAINSFATDPTYAIGLAVLGVPSHTTSDPILGSATVNGQIIIDRQHLDFLPNHLTIAFQKDAGNEVSSVELSGGSYNREYDTPLYGFNVEQLFPCHEQVCQTSPFWSPSMDENGLISLSSYSYINSFDSFWEDFCNDPSNSTSMSCSESKAQGRLLSDKPYVFFGLANPPFNGMNVIYDPTFGAVNIFTNTTQPLQPCTSGIPATPESPFQSGSITIAGGTGAFDVTYTGCGQAPVISPHT